MKTIWHVKVELIDGWQVYHLPGYSGVAVVGEREGDLTVWVHVDTEAAESEVNFAVTGTGRIAPKAMYAGSALMAPFVWHVWERGVI
jgi:hypothetical protein